MSSTTPCQLGWVAYFYSLRINNGVNLYHLKRKYFFCLDIRSRSKHSKTSKAYYASKSSLGNFLAISLFPSPLTPYFSLACSLEKKVWRKEVSNPEPRTSCWSQNHSTIRASLRLMVPWFTTATEITDQSDQCCHPTDDSDQ